MIPTRTAGDAVQFKATFRTEALALFDPDTHGGFVYDGAGTLIATIAALTKLSTGVYTADWQTSKTTTAAGDYSFEAWGTLGSMTYRTRNALVRIT